MEEEGALKSALSAALFTLRATKEISEKDYNEGCVKMLIRVNWGGRHSIPMSKKCSD